jgi:eukaryotic-like serine/threonine-protein kinase
VEQFYREVQVTVNLQHPHILPVYDFDIHDGIPSIVMTYLQAGTFNDRIKEGLKSTSRPTFTDFQR